MNAKVEDVVCAYLMRSGKLMSQILCDKVSITDKSILFIRNREVVCHCLLNAIEKYEYENSCIFIHA